MIKQRKKRDLLKFFIFLIIMVCPFISNAQNASEKKSVQSTTDTTKSETLKKNVSYEEFVLETIRIEAIIEKPSVTLIPKKAETDVGDVPFGNRSFDSELKQKPLVITDYGKNYENPKRIKKLKEIIKKRKK